ncbi:MAG TPA: hypothetical protein VGS41_17060 [Chthonomonadales bacterium]|nr:hypothetical protein [Chthonomonadales bacterium]
MSHRDMKRKPHPNVTRQACEAAPHLTDVTLIYLCADSLSPELRDLTNNHLRQCAACREELSRLKTAGGQWDQHNSAQKLQREILLRHAQGQQAWQHVAKEPWLAWWSISLRNLAPVHGAYAEGDLPAVESVSFPVWRGRQMVAGLSGTLERRQREFYARICSDSDYAVAGSGETYVDLHISSPNRENWSLHRKIDIDVAILLGTDLPIDAGSVLIALLCEH